jgi:hypothetical protein
VSRFTPTTAVADGELEARIRATLRRHAEDIEPTAPPWSELVERAGAVVVPLPGAELTPAHLRTSRRPGFDEAWVRPVLAAAVALVIALSAAVVVQGRGGGGGSANLADQEPIITEEVARSPVIPAPGEGVFDRLAATPVPGPGTLSDPTIAMDPRELALAYLEEWGLTKTDGFMIDDLPKFEMVPEKSGGQLEAINMWWSVTNDAVGRIEGAVLLRPVDGAPGAWEVTGGFTLNVVSLGGVRRADGLLTFAVSDYLFDPTVQVEVGEEQSSVDRLPTDETSKTYTFKDPAPGKVLTIVVHHIVDGVPVSVTAMALAPDGSDAIVQPIPGATPPPTELTP